ncbi:sensor histidine kinase [Nocardioides limicola]|uniref:sensor histidine kinase n=1 Tax=Nocardioides limicola TaxID=2803368 RepID=UPI00193C5271|nr:histidine kinase [Nocardioides sp. DJM-14]
MTQTQMIEAVPPQPGQAIVQPEEWRRWIPEGVAAGVVLMIGLVEFWVGVFTFTGHWLTILFAFGAAAAVLLCRRRPALALGVAVLLGAAHVVLGVGVLLVDFAVLAVFFGAARWGRPLTSFAAFAAAVVLPLLLALYVVGTAVVTGYPQLPAFFNHVGVGLAPPLLVIAAWVAGLVVRLASRASDSEAAQAVAQQQAAEAEQAAAGARRAAQQAQEIARLKDEQARLARDVHDVVGHSLAVILAQAESAQYLDDPEQLKRTVATIATSARTSLQDVRHVLDPKSAPSEGDLDALIRRIETGGHVVESTVLGEPQPLPPELQAVAFRVLQEMLTNAIRHGHRDHPVRVERHWPEPGWGDTLRLEVSNTVADPAPEGSDPGSEPTLALGNGIEGMRRRLEAVGGRLDVRRRTDADQVTFTATAWVPVRDHRGEGDR